MTPLPVTRDAPTLAAVLESVGWRRAPMVSGDGRELLDETGTSLGVVTWWQAWAALHERGPLAPDAEMRAALDGHVEQARAWR